MKAKEYLEKQEFSYDHFTKLTSTGISDDIDNIIQFAEDYHQAKLNLLTIPVVSVSSCCKGTGYIDLPNGEDCYCCCEKGKEERKQQHEL